MKVFINGNFYDKEEAKVSVFDHGLLYGDGIFEGIRLYNKCVFKLDEHLERLKYSAHAIRLNLPWSLEEIATAVLNTCRENQLTDGYIRLVVTRGQGDLGLSPKSCKNPQLIIIADQIALYPLALFEKGMPIITVPTRRISQSALSSSIKSLNYLNNILAKLEAEHCGYKEAIMLNEQGYVSECTADNIYIVKKGELKSPRTTHGALKGITRQTIKEIAIQMGFPIFFTELARYDIWNADECFLTGTAAEIIPVIEVDGRKIGNGLPGSITKTLQTTFTERTRAEGRHL